MPPPKPSRQPQNTTEQSQLTAAAPVSTYIVAQSPEVLAQLLKDNQARGVCPSVYTTPASPFNTLAVQFQDEDQVLTTAVVSDLPFFDPALSEPSMTHDTQSGDSTLSDTNLDSLDSADNAPLMSSLSISDTAQTQSQSPAANRKQQKVKEMQNLYAVSSKVVGSATGDLYSPVQKFTVSSSAVAAGGAVPAVTTGNACGPEIYGPVASFTQSSAIVGNLSQSASVGGNYGENPGNFGPSSLNNVIMSSNNSQVQFSSGSHAQGQPISYGNFAATNNTSQVFGGGGGGGSSQSIGQNASGVQNISTSGGGGGSVIYPRNVSSSASMTSSVPNAECLYGPVLKFRAQNSQPTTQSIGSELKSVGAAVGNYGQTGRGKLIQNSTPAQSLQSAYPQNYPHQQIYSNIAQLGQQAMYLPQMQHAQNVARQSAAPQAVSYAAIQHTSQQQSQLSGGANPIYTAHAASVSVVQAQKVHVPNYVQQLQTAIGSQPVTSQVIGASQQPASLGIMQTSSIQSHFLASSSAAQQNLHSMSTSYIVDQQQPSSLGSLDHVQMHDNIGNIMTSSTVSLHQQQVSQSQMVISGVAKAANVSQMATGVAKITTFVAQKQDEQLTSSTDGTLSGSLISSAVSDSTMSSSSSITEEAQQDQV